MSELHNPYGDGKACSRIIDFLKNQQFKGDVYFEIDPLIGVELNKFLLEKAIKIVYKKQDYLNLDRLLKITFP